MKKEKKKFFFPSKKKTFVFEPVLFVFFFCFSQPISFSPLFFVT